MLTVTWCHTEFYVHSEHDFEAASGSIVCYSLSNYLLRGCCKHNVGTLLHLKEHTPSSFADFYKVLRQWALFYETTVLLMSAYTSFLLLHMIGACAY